MSMITDSLSDSTLRMTIKTEVDFFPEENVTRFL